MIFCIEILFKIDYNGNRICEVLFVKKKVIIGIIIAVVIALVAICVIFNVFFNTKGKAKSVVKNYL